MVAGWHSHQPSLASLVGIGIRSIAPGLQGGLSDPFVQLRGVPSAGVQDSYAVSMQTRLCASRKPGKLDTGQSSRPVSASPTCFMQILNRIGIILVWLAGAVFVFAAANKSDPYLIALRGPGNIVLAAASIIAVVVLIRRGHWRRGPAGRLLTVLWCLPSLSMLGAHASFEWRKRNVLQTDAAEARSLGRHFIVGYSSFPEVAVLAEKGLISGVYITRHNIAGSTAARLKDELSALQERRRAASLPPLIVAADQEGGIVSHLAPPLTRVPALSTLAKLAPSIRAEKAEAFGRVHGQELANLGVNLNLAPVLDLRPALKRIRFDFNTLIGRRAISDDPAVVTDIARAYVHGLEASGVGARSSIFQGSDGYGPTRIISAPNWIRLSMNSRRRTGFPSGRCLPARKPN